MAKFKVSFLEMHYNLSGASTVSAQCQEEAVLIVRDLLQQKRNDFNALDKDAQVKALEKEPRLLDFLHYDEEVTDSDLGLVKTSLRAKFLSLAESYGLKTIEKGRLIVNDFAIIDSLRQRHHAWSMGGKDRASMPLFAICGPTAAATFILSLTFAKMKASYNVGHAHNIERARATASTPLLPYSAPVPQEDVPVGKPQPQVGGQQHNVDVAKTTLQAPLTDALRKNPRKTRAKKEKTDAEILAEYERVKAENARLKEQVVLPASPTVAAPELVNGLIH